MGPCADGSPSPLLASNAQGQGPGEESVFSNAAGVWLLYTPSLTLPLPDHPVPSPWPIWASVRRARTWPRRLEVTGPT